MPLTRIGSIGINTGIKFSGLTTITTLNTSIDALSIGGPVSIAGTLTYEDVTNIDSVGLVTARNGIVVGSGITLSKDGDGFFTGIVTATSFSGSGTNLTGIDTDLVSDTTPQLGGNLDVNTKNIVFGDSGGATDDRLTFGASTDLSIYHDGSHSRIDETGTGNLMIQSDNAVFIKKGTSENIATFNADGAVELYHDNSLRLTTDANGIHVTTNVHLPDSGVLELGDGSDLKLYHTAGSANFIQASGGHANIHISNLHQLKNQDNDEFMLQAANGGSVTLYHNGTEKFSTQSYGIVVDGVASFTKDSADDTTSTLQVNGAAMDASDFLYIMSAANNSVNGLTMFLNGSSRGSDGGNNGLTIRNDNGPMSVGLNGATHSNFFYTGAAGGIDFSQTANSSGSTSQEILDDYEEGTWTPTIASGTYTAYLNQWYTKIGQVVTCYLYMYNFSDTSSNTHLVISGLPFAHKTNHEATVQFMMNGGASLASNCMGVWGRIGVTGSSDQISMYTHFNTTGGGVFQYSNLGSAHLMATFTYVTGS